MAAHTIWQLDDAEHWHEITRATLAQMSSSWQSHHFHSGQSMLMALDSCSAADLPAIILMDFYLPNERGDHITAAIRGLELSVESHIVGFSSVVLAAKPSLQREEESISNTMGTVLTLIYNDGWKRFLSLKNKDTLTSFLRPPFQTTDKQYRINKSIRHRSHDQCTA